MDTHLLLAHGPSKLRNTGNLESTRTTIGRCTWEVAALLLLLCVAPGLSRGQAAVETAGATSSPSGVTTEVARGAPVSITPLQSQHLAIREGPPPEEANRKALEQRAGKDAAKLLLRSVPSEARVYIDGMFLGRTPLLLMVPPGKYKVEMHGQREEFGGRLIGLLPNDTQQVVLTLASRYATHVSVR
jgi:hypothetical protein